MTEKDLIPLKNWKKRLQYVTNLFSKALESVEIDEVDEEIVKGLCSEYANSFHTTSSVKILRQIFTHINQLLKKYDKLEKGSGKVLKL